MPGKEFQNRTAVVVGGARGIGYAVAERLSRNGARIAVWDIDADAAGNAAERLGGAACAIPCDQSDPGSVDRALRSTLSEIETIHILVNSAAITGPNANLWEYPLDAWQRVIDVDLNGVFYCCRAAVPVMLENEIGRIVNIASIAGKEGNPTASAYSAAKAGVIGLTKSLGKELAKTGITVNCVTPAAVKTDIFKQMSQEHIDYMLSRVPMGRFGTVEENAALIAWLCSDEASFSTGAVFDVSGGRATY